MDPALRGRGASIGSLPPGNRAKRVAYENLPLAMPATSNYALNWPGVVTNGDILRLRSGQAWADSGMNESGDFACTGQTGLHYVQIELGAAYTVDQVKVWHYDADPRTYHNTKTQVSADGADWVTMYGSAMSEEFQETAQDKKITSSKVRGAHEGDLRAQNS